MDINNVTVITKTCKDCNQPFDITEGEIHFLLSHNLAVFERCWECRQLRKRQREERAASGTAQIFQEKYPR